MLFDRQRHRIEPVTKSANPPGWKTTEPDAEGSYVNCLLTTLAKRSPSPVELVAGMPVPDLHSLAVDAAEREWVDELPFRYEALNAAEAIRLLRLFCKWNPPALPSSTTFHVKLAKGGGKLEGTGRSYARKSNTVTRPKVTLLIGSSVVSLNVLRRIPLSRCD